MELIVAMAIFAMIIAVVVSLMSLSSTSSAISNSKHVLFTGVDNLSYNLLLETKSAKEVAVDGDNILTLYFPDSDPVVYQINNLVGEVERNGIVCSKDFYAYYFVPVDAHEFIFRLMITEDDAVEYRMRCGSTEAEEFGW